MSSEQPAPPITGTVISKVQTLQNPAQINHTTAASRLPRAMTYAQEAGVTVGRGRRIDASFGSPAARASRDENEGLRGDGRPPVGNFTRTVYSSVEKEVVLRPSRLFQAPNMSSDVERDAQSRRDGIVPVSAVQDQSKPRHLGCLAPLETAADEISQIRANLRSVKQSLPVHPTCIEGRSVRFDDAGHKNGPIQDEPESQNILNELDSLLVGALEGVRASANDELNKNGDSLSSSSHVQSVTSQQQFRRHSRATSSTDIDPVQHPEAPTDQGPAEPLSMKEQNPIQVPITVQKGSSPVRERAALFETLSYHVPSKLTNDRRSRDNASTTSSVSSIRRTLETGTCTPKSVHSTPLELALPNSVGHAHRYSQRNSRPGSSDGYHYDTGATSEGMSQSATQPVHGRNVSVLWPFKWNLFLQDKATLAPPRPSGVEAKAEIGHDEYARDHPVEPVSDQDFTSPSKSALCLKRKSSQKRISHEDIKHRRALKELKPVSESVQVAMEERISKIPALQALQDIHNEADPETPSTPRTRTNLQPSQMQTPTQSGTPQLKPSTAASSPHISCRGRSESGHEDGFTIDQRYCLSRSRSRGCVNILVEVRSPDPSPDRANDDTTIIVRANVEPLKE